MTDPVIRHILHKDTDARDGVLTSLWADEDCSVVEGRRTSTAVIHKRYVNSVNSSERWPQDHKARQALNNAADHYHVDMTALHSRFFQSCLDHLRSAGKSITIHSVPSELTFEARRTLRMLGLHAPMGAELQPRSLDAPQVFAVHRIPVPVPANAASLLHSTLGASAREGSPFAISLSIKRLRHQETAIEPGLQAWTCKDGVTLREDITSMSEPLSEGCVLASLAFFSSRVLINRFRTIIGSRYPDPDGDSEAQSYTLAAFKRGFAIIADDYRHLCFKHGPQSAVVPLCQKLRNAHEELSVVHCLQSGINAILAHQMSWRRDGLIGAPQISVVSR